MKMCSLRLMHRDSLAGQEPDEKVYYAVNRCRLVSVRLPLLRGRTILYRNIITYTTPNALLNMTPSLVSASTVQRV
jgi:hypothetical protein